MAEIDNNSTQQSVPAVVDRTVNRLDILREAESRFATKETAQAFISRLFDKLTERAHSPDFFGTLFDVDVAQHPDFKEPTTRAFIIRVLSNEKRPDNFVTATIPQEFLRRDPFKLTSFVMGLLGQSDDAGLHYELRLNCELDKVQLSITLTPKFLVLKRFVLVVSCAPSLEVCYVMEMLTQHRLRDWGVFDPEGTEVVRRWYKLKWTDSCESLANTILDSLQNVIEESIHQASQTLSSN